VGGWRMVGGAGGRGSVVRRDLGFTLERNEPRMFLGGLLVDGIDGWPATDALLGTEKDRIFYVFPQGGGRARLYLAVRVEERGRLSGADKTATFLDGFHLESVPDSDRFADAQPAGPCAAYPMHDSWIDDPRAEGA